jgi:hypothetical protein
MRARMGLESAASSTSLEMTTFKKRETLLRDAKARRSASSLGCANRQRFINDEFGELQNIGSRLAGETLGRGQLGNSVDYRPCEKCEPMGVSGR